jgi:large subunit ribosomal protein L31
MHQIEKYFLTILFIQKYFLILHSQIKKEMKKGIHPESYRFVVFKDTSNDYSFMTRSTVATKDTITWEDGKEYPLVKLEISHTSHPFFTGKMKLVDTAGRVDKFKSRYQKHYEKKGENK